MLLVIWGRLFHNSYYERINYYHQPYCPIKKFPIFLVFTQSMYTTFSLASLVRIISSVQLLSFVQLFVTPWTAARQASLFITNSRVYPNSFPLSQWCHPTISSSVIPFSSRLQLFPVSGSFQMSQLLASSGQDGASAHVELQLQHQSSQWTLRTDFL